MPPSRRDPRELSGLAQLERRRRARLYTLIAQGRVALPQVTEDRGIRALTVAKTIRLCLATRRANLDTRTHRWVSVPSTINVVLHDLNLTGDEKMSSLRPAGRARVAARLDAHRKATWNLRAERDLGRNPAGLS